MRRGLIFLLFLLSACQADGSEIDIKKQESQETSMMRGSIEVIAENLQIPWSINKVDDQFYISERNGSIVKIGGGETSRKKVELKDPLATAAEAGFLGLVLSPDFPSTKEAYAYYTYKDSSGQFSRIVILQEENDAWREKQVLIDKIPSGRVHHGGRIKIGPDGKLYATTGDAAENPEIAQDIHSLGGKILRLELDGSIPKDNPFPNSYVYSYGHRNPQGLAWTEDGSLYASEHGPSAHDEINFIQPSKNYGWPIIIGDEKQESMETPLFHSGKDTWAPSGMAYYNGKLYVATLRGTAIREFDLTTKKTREVINGVGRIRDVFIEDGVLYFISNNTDGRGTPDANDDRLYRVDLVNRGKN